MNENRTNFINFQSLSKLIEEHRKETLPYKNYEFDSTDYTLLLIDINNLLKESQELKKQLEEKETLIKQCGLSVSNMMDCYCERTDCVGRIKDSKVYDSLEQKIEAQQKEFIKYLEDEKDRLARECSQIYKDSLGKTRLVSEDIFNEVNEILQKYKETVGISNEQKS